MSGSTLAVVLTAVFLQTGLLWLGCQLCYVSYTHHGGGRSDSCNRGEVQALLGQSSYSTCQTDFLPPGCSVTQGCQSTFVSLYGHGAAIDDNATQRCSVALPRSYISSNSTLAAGQLGAVGIAASSKRNLSSKCAENADSVVPWPGDGV